MSTLRLFLLLVCSGLPVAAPAHHTYSEYDQHKTIEIEGVLVKAAWQNPHLVLKVQVADAHPSTVTWSLEGPSLNVLTRLGVPLSEFKVGSRVKAAGWPSKRAPDRLFLTNLLSEGGREIVTWRYSQARWTKTAGGYASDKTLFAGGTPTRDTSVFRVWSAQLGTTGATFDRSVSGGGSSAPPPPLTEKAKKLVAGLHTMSSTLDGCARKGMPSIMMTPTPVEFIDKGDVIQVRIELNDTVRTIHLRASPMPKANTPLGYSTGRWEGRALVVDTTQVSWPLFGFGIPQSTAVHLVERFMPSTDGSRLEYSVTATDPQMLTRPLEQKSTWVWRPGEKVMAYNCVSDYRK
jgi:uncharacterized protein DUF6152